MEQIKSGNLFVYDECDIQISEYFKKISAIFRPIFKKTLVSRKLNKKTIKRYKECNGRMTKLRKFQISPLK